MQSEWFTEIPDDLEENWFVKFCPQGFRILLIAQNHTTVCYNQQGRVILKIKTNFPGGGGSDSNGVTILDCIYNKCIKTVFVLDCLFWNAMSMLESEVNFRFFWLKTKFEENPGFAKCLKYNFKLLDYVPAQRPLIQDHMFSVAHIEDHNIPYDGVVFYHKESHYIFGYTPLVGWLASFMLPEKLQIDVGPENLARKPKDYCNMETYLESLRNKKRRSRGKHSVGAESEMDVQ
ncbi:hypothetical protein NQ318_013164 [Aromia moschata]|uniref:Snurportin-1 n=1 Tax=Aromia moschata TaxID=1265417 RepID=A0AAV8Y2H6_9CUCU|nr:hypothetical protein NQ318_013164 [Aromia moschata]